MSEFVRLKLAEQAERQRAAHVAGTLRVPSAGLRDDPAPTRATAHRVC